MNATNSKTRVFSLTVLLAAAVAAQVAPPAPTAPADPTGEAITLSPFSVQSRSDRGYVASETLMGSRVATRIIDLPYTVNVLTSEFFADFAIFDLNENLTQIGSFTGLNGSGAFTLRGFSSSAQLRDGFFRLGRYGASNVDRIEIIKGSNAAIYGRSSPGGMLNMISKAPQSQEGYRLTLNAGSYDTRRAVLEATGPLANTSLGKTTYLLTTGQNNRSYDVQYSHNRSNEHYLALQHLFNDGSKLNLSAEYYNQFNNGILPVAPLVIDQKGTASNQDDEAVGYATPLAGISAAGPHSTNTRGNISYSGAYEKRFNSVWSTRLGANYYRARTYNFNMNTGWGAININPPNATTPLTTMRGTPPTKVLYIEDGGGFQGDLLAHYWLGGKKVENRTLLTLDINDYYRYDPVWNYSAAGEPVFDAWNTARGVTLLPDLTPAAPVAYFPNNFVWGREVPTGKHKNRLTVLGGLLRQQSAFLDGRLLAYAGARFDALRFSGRDYVTSAATFQAFPGLAGYAPGDLIRRRTNLLKPNTGVNYKVTSNLRAFANYSESYFLNQGDGSVQWADPTYKAEEASGYDYGFKGAFFNERLTFTVSGFYATRRNVSVTDIVETPTGSGNFVTLNRRDGDQLVRGFEVDFNWHASDEISLTGSFGHVYSIYTNFGAAFPLAIGRRVNGVTPENGGLSLRYTPTAWALKGFSANVGVTEMSRTPTEAPNAGDTYATTPGTGARVLTRTTRQWAMGVPSFTLWNAAVRYHFRHGAKLNQSLALNVNNVFDKRYLRTSRQLGDSRAFILSYTLGFGGLRY